MQAPRAGGVTLDAFTGRYAARTAGMTASEIRALFAVASRPEVVSLAGGMPYTTALPLDAVGKLLGDLLATRGAQALQYGSGQGDPVLRELICEVMALEGVHASPDDVVVTVGSQQALDLVTRIFCDPGDVVLAEAPSYVGALGTFAAYQAEVRHVAMDADGLVPEALREAIAAAGGRAKFLYTIPNFHNPAGTSLSDARRDEVLAICQEAGLLVLEDNPYGLLGLRRPAGAARSGPAAARTTSSTSARSARPSPRACGSAGCWRRTPCARSWCWPARRACCARRSSTSWPSSTT